MFKLVVEKELREIIGTTKFAVTFAVCAVLILLAFYVGARNYQVSQTEYEAAKIENLSQMEGLTDWRQINHRIFLPPQPLAVLVSGISNDIGRTIAVRSRGELRSQDSRFNEDPIFAVFRFLDLEFIFTIVLSLFAILFAYDAINGEKERGTLRLSFANAIPRDQYILGKIVGSFLALGIPLLIPVLIGCALLPVLGIPMSGDEWTRLVLVLFSGVLYFSVFLTLSVMISALTQHSSSSFLVLLVIWIFTVLIIPRTAVLVSGRAVDVPSVDRVNYEKSVYQKQLWSEFQEKSNKFFQENSTDRENMRDVFQKFQTVSKEWRDDNSEKMDLFTGQLNEERRNREAAQQRVALNLSRISPTATFSLAAAGLAGTSLELRQSFIEAANQYQDNFAAFMDSKQGDGGFVVRRDNDEEEEEKPIGVQELPIFEYPEPSTRDVLSGALLDMGLLAFFNVVFFAIAFVGFLRYDVR